MSDYSYVGSELDLFTHAIKWKSYWGSLLYSYIDGDVLEVGAGVGTNTRLLYTSQYRRWVCLERDHNLATLLKTSLSENPAYKNCEVITGTITSLGKQMFDTIIYIDVLEHIEDDKEELSKACKRLNPNGKLIVLSPAHQILYSKFDESIGHLRRYNKRTFTAIIPPDLKLERLIYLDSVGLLVSLGNRFFLKQSMPSLGQIKTWDRIIIPCSRWLDPLTRYQVGKSIFAVLSLNV